MPLLEQRSFQDPLLLMALHLQALVLQVLVEAVLELLLLLVELVVDNTNKKIKIKEC